MTTYDLIDVLPSPLENQLDFTAFYGDESYYIFSSQFFASEIYQHFTNRKIRLADTDAVDNFVELFNLWKSCRSDTYGRRAYALSIDYEPLENYDRMETRSGDSTTTNELNDKRTHADTLTRTHNNTDTTTHGGTETNARGVYGVNSAAESPADRDVTTYDTSDESKHTGTIADAHTGNITDTHTGTVKTDDTYILRAHGNIGVTTSQQMLTSDIEMLRYDLALIAICDFIDRYTFSVDGLEV